MKKVVRGDSSPFDRKEEQGPGRAGTTLSQWVLAPGSEAGVFVSGGPRMQGRHHQGLENQDLSYRCLFQKDAEVNVCVSRPCFLPSASFPKSKRKKPKEELPLWLSGSRAQPSVHEVAGSFPGLA